jgi:hypothetical protein
MSAIAVKVAHVDRAMRARIRRAVLLHKLDRRFVYTVCPDSYLSVACKFTTSCSGCTAMDGSNLGCRECGFTGKRVVHFPAPVEIRDMSMIKVKQASSSLYLHRKQRRRRSCS